MDIFKVDLSTGTAVREGIPPFMDGLQMSTLRNLQSEDDIPPGLEGIEFWPGEYAAPPLDPLTEQLGGEVITAIDAETKTVHYSREVVAKTPEQIEASKPVRRITRLAFLNRFTDAEAVAFDLASQGATVEAASMRRFMQKVNAATFIDLNRPDTRAGVEALEAAGLIAVGRASEILDAEIQIEERAF